MGMGGAAQAAQAAVAAGARISSALPPPPAASRPVAAPVPVSAPPSLPVVTPTAAAPVEIHEMDWDEEELATQIYDRPEGAKLPSTPPIMPRANSGARPPANGRTTGVLPALPALPGRSSSVPAQPMGAQSSAVAAPPLPSTSLQAVASPVVNAPPLGPMMSAAAVAPAGSPSPMPGSPPMPSVPPRPSAAGKDAWRIGGDPKFSRPPTESTPPRPEPRRNEGSSVVVLALLGVVAVAALVIIALKLTRGEPSGGLLITTNVGGVAVLVDSQPLVGNGQRFEVPELAVVRLHRVEVRKPGFRPFTQDVPVREAQITQMQVELEPEPTTAMVPPLVPPMPESNQTVVQTPTVAPIPPPVLPNTAQVVAINTPPAAVPTVAPVAAVTAPVPAPMAPPAPRTPRVARPNTTVAIRPAAAVAPVVRPATNPVAANPPAGGATGVLLISTRPASSCTVSGQGTTFNTPRRLTLPPGTYRVTCGNEELAAHGSFSVTITAGGTADFRNRPLE